MVERYEPSNPVPGPVANDKAISVATMSSKIELKVLYRSKSTGLAILASY